ncbi:uncharacterized protein PHACADRAFT_163870 [Phanerochaete carnosa HHB-10118-sp]|uniref:Uncharacterized protein n=1 Tax=Phanerochaete carnosa (strain HHB-10118-sp) TaxID=650164 RepID=K5W339_PHACS|nr:uncharacterized protein PHACADRAFT_163870 [Phanerochaete carnosa HHB-10118-sp]EKM53555.1 hypothetical protein PHACADRAFT_163870 [Phanerochaete carnosa HHB-10118-sp]
MVYYSRRLLKAAWWRQKPASLGQKKFVALLLSEVGGGWSEERTAEFLSTLTQGNAQEIIIKFRLGPRVR